MYSIVRFGLGRGRRSSGAVKALFRRSYATHGIKVAVLGANGGIGKHLSLLLKQSPWFEEVALYDRQSTKGLAMELKQIDTSSAVSSHEGIKGVAGAVKGAHIVIITAGKCMKEGMSKDLLLEHNANVVGNLASVCAETCPNAFLAVVTDPVNSLVPLVTEMYRKVNRSVDHSKIFGVTTLDVVRASTFLAEVLSLMPETVEVPVIGGNSPTTIVPVLSKSEPSTSLSLEERVKITRAVQGANDEVMKTKGEGGVLSAAFSVARFAVSLARAFSGHTMVECAYVKSDAVPGTAYLATPVELGPAGLQRNLGIPQLTDYEECLLETAIPALNKDIDLGNKFAKEIKI